MFCDSDPHFAGRRGGRHPFSAFTGPFGGEMGFGFGGFGGPGGPFRFGRKFAASDLQLLILALLAERPRHGYELMKDLEERSGGFYSPSPGMIYPALAYLEEIGHATTEAEGTKKFYHITDDGRQHLEANRAAVDKVFEELRVIGERMQRMRSMFSGGAGNADDDDEPGGSHDIRDARRTLKSALRQRRGCSPEESKRIAEILLRAAAEISRQV